MHEKILALLREDHREIEEACRLLLQAESPADRKALVNRLHQELVPHLIAEEETFYPAWMGKSEIQEAFLALDAHHEVRMVLDQLLEKSPEKPEYAAEVRHLCDLVERHILNEEGPMFEHFYRMANEEEAWTILTRFRKEREKIKKQLAREVIIPSDTA